jgi:uncharacterized protein YyaL (SSP411 family)
MMPRMSKPAAPNRLANETSPYLLQHAANPVDWHPWGPEAIERARVEDKPILLSIGYSACHWCHVMAHESFEDPGIAALMNQCFINVKVDREERPDLDRVYQTAHQLLAQRPGGWPLTVFLDPGDHTPFFTGTYFPPEARHGLPGFPELLEHLARVWREQRAEVARQNESLRTALRRLEPPRAAADTVLDQGPLEQARRILEQQFDSRHGGFGHAPKFPHPTTLEFLMRWPTASPPMRMSLFTLTRMAEGGLHDQLGGGFCRYSVDDRWEIPHFEKMLYDNAQLLPLYARGAARTGDPYLRQVAVNTAAWALREMRLPDGPFYAALDADSEGEEGRFYTWDRAEFSALLTPDEEMRAARYFGLDNAPNFEGRWHLKVAVGATAIARELGEPVAETARHLETARLKLHAARERRVKPGLDDKIISAWNGLMVRGLAQAGRALGEPTLIEAAEAAHDFLRIQAWAEGRLRTTWKAGAARHPALLDDHAFLLESVLELLQARWRREDLSLAIELADLLLARFEDPVAGGFWFTADDHEQLIHRPKAWADEALPSGAAIATLCLQRLGWLLAEPRYLAAAERALRAAWGPMQKFPHAHCTLLQALAEHLSPPVMVVLRAPAAALDAALSSIPGSTDRLVFAIPDEAEGLPAALADKRPTGAPIAYPCQGLSCGAPVSDLTAL